MSKLESASVTSKKDQRGVQSMLNFTLMQKPKPTEPVVAEKPVLHVAAHV